MTNLGKWNHWYAVVENPELYGDDVSYLTAAEWLAPCDVVADWGCGKGGFSTFVDPSQRYVGFDGSVTRFADRIVDLAEFVCETEGVLLRHVIEHDYRWRQILTNAAASFTRRMMVVVFTPMLSDDLVFRQIRQQEIAPAVFVPDLSFSPSAIIDAVGPELLVDVVTVTSATEYGCETVFKFER